MDLVHQMLNGNGSEAILSQLAFAIRALLVRRSNQYSSASMIVSTLVVTA